jgi:glycosyltransferase involved in cell wall biosynthesis
VRLLIVSDWMTSPGGTEVYVTNLRQWLRDAGDDVKLLTCGAGDGDGADIRAFGSDNVMAQSALQLYNPLAVRTVRRSVREFRPDAAFVAHFAYHLSPAVLGALADVPTVVSMMDYKAVCPLGTKLLPGGSICGRPAGVACRQEKCVGALHWLRDQPRYALIRSRVRQASVVCASAWVRAELKRNGIESECIPIPVKGPAAGYARRPASTPTFVYLGRLSREKGVDVLIRAFGVVSSRHPAARLRIVGDGPMHNELERLAASVGLASNIDFRRRVPPDDVDALLADAWALVAPSVWAEPYGLVAPEAILRGVPVIATRRGGFADSVDDGVTGLLVENGDADALARALDDVASARAFPHQAIYSNAVARLATRLHPARHVERLHTVFNRHGKGAPDTDS